MADPSEPTYSTTTERLYYRLPDIYRETDAQNDYQFKKYLSSVADHLGDIDLLVARFRYLSYNDLEMQRRYHQPHTVYTHPDRVLGAPALGSTSDLVDPLAADEAWLPWLGQLVGVPITPNMNVFEKRDSIATASSGYRAGSKHAMEKAVRTVLSGSRYAVALPHTKVDVNGNILPGTLWDLTILTRAAESPDSYTILATVDKPTVKPAGVKLYHRTYSASWDTIEATLPFWTDWETRVWDLIEQAGLVYTELPGNIHPNPSFETDATGWTVSGPVSVARETGGLDGPGRLRASVSGTGTVTVTGPAYTLTADEAWVYGFSYSSLVNWTVSLVRGTTVVTTDTLPSTGADTWKRYNSGILPDTAGDYHFEFSASGAVNDYLLLDAFIVRKAAA